MASLSQVLDQRFSLFSMQPVIGANGYKPVLAEFTLGDRALISREIIE